MTIRIALVAGSNVATVKFFANDRCSITFLKEMPSVGNYDALILVENGSNSSHYLASLEAGADGLINRDGGSGI